MRKLISSIFELPMHIEDTIRESFDVTDKFYLRLDTSKEPAMSLTTALREQGHFRDRYDVYTKDGMVIGIELVEEYTQEA